MQEKKFKGNRKTQAKDQIKSFLDYDKRGGQNYNQPLQQCRPLFHNNNKSNANQKSYHCTGKKYHSSIQIGGIETFCPLGTYFAPWVIFWFEGIATYLDKNCLMFLVKIFE